MKGNAIEEQMKRNFERKGGLFIYSVNSSDRYTVYIEIIDPITIFPSHQLFQNAMQNDKPTICSTKSYSFQPKIPKIPS
jgi:hypothetical protein